MTLIDRVVGRIAAADIPLDRHSVEAEARRSLAIEAPLADPDDVQAVVDAVLGLGPIERLLRDPTVADVLVNGDGRVFVERVGRIEPTPLALRPDEVVAGIERVIAPLGLRLDTASPMVDARLPDGSRLHAVIDPVAVDGPILAIRRFTAAVPDIPGLVVAGAISQAGADLLERAVVERRTLIVSGGTGAGKTTLLNVLSTAIPDGERLVCIEDAPELRLAGHVVRLQTRNPNVEGVGGIGLRDLVRSALRLRPDRLIVGEVRGPEALELVSALNTGHEGSMSTLHANGPAEALLRLEVLALAAGGPMRPEAIRRQIRGAIDLVVQVAREGDHRRVKLVMAVGDEPADDAVVYP